MSGRASDVAICLLVQHGYNRFDLRVRARRSEGTASRRNPSVDSSRGRTPARFSPEAGRRGGIYRLWRDGGFAVGALLAGVLADAFDIPVAIWAVAALTAASGIVVIVRMYETHPRHDRTLVPDDVDLES